MDEDRYEPIGPRIQNFREALDREQRRWDGGDTSRMENLNREIARMTALWRQDVEDSVELYNLLARARYWVAAHVADNSAPEPHRRTAAALLDEINVALREISRR